ncbi:PREDICTED: probable leucine-rich repeat receptor-like protein kinase At5g49770 isoform X2 [Nelumbo nucifera]|uniref:non-specific serine/threonine protein kinase n=1 Tax=Nelumbo nucifera TaxID=4432 RepID=A0A1U7ZTI9_NELNU|nr:PREDICTED: probable leucine-rich repeat receptor-like protein kinase At5g49770 isoform X2 [Nelumbo nucifera]
MVQKIQAFLLILIQIPFAAALTTTQEAAALNSLKDIWKNKPPDWEKPDPCDDGWTGIYCDIETRSHVIYIKLGNTGLMGQLSNNIGSLSELQILDLSNNPGLNGLLPDAIGNLKNLSQLILTGCNFSGRIPDSIGSLQQLIQLSINFNNFSGEIPHSIGNLAHLILLDLADNKLSGTIPISDGDKTTGLDKLTACQHLILNGNQLTGAIPSSMGILKNLEVVDLSCNRFDPSEIAKLFTTVLRNLSKIKMENTNLDGQIAPYLLTLPDLENVYLKNNNINGTLDLSKIVPSKNLKLVDLRNNSISSLVEGAKLNYRLFLEGNPCCYELGSICKEYCNPPEEEYTPHSTNTATCENHCPSDQKISPNCNCSYPYISTIYLRAASNYDNVNLEDMENALRNSFQKDFHLPVDSITLSKPRISNGYLTLDLEVFPSGTDRFNRSGISDLVYVLNFQALGLIQSYFLIGSQYGTFSEMSSSSKVLVSLGVIIGVTVSGVVAVLALLLCAGYYVLHQRRRADRMSEQSKAFSFWDLNSCSNNIPKLNVARWFSFDELKKCTNNFSEVNAIGSGGYGKVYRGTLSTGQLVAIKRAQQRGGIQFKTEVEMLSRVHHKNLVSLVGYCFEKDEQMLVYEYIANGTLKESLSGRSGIKLDWTRRLRVAVGSARGVAYLHEHVNPPIIHRDIKSTNILLDNHLNAKVSDFGLSKLMDDDEKGHVSTQVKGTMGYLDPEYYMTQQLTEKSDVYSFGVIMLELITARKPIEHGKYIVREVKAIMDKTKDLYGLHELLDPVLGSISTSLKGFEEFVDLAMRCLQESTADRPLMSEVVKEIEGIMKFSGLNTTDDFASTSESYGETNGEHSGNPFSTETIEYSSWNIHHHKVESQ